jgi:hypothetical protein
MNSCLSLWAKLGYINPLRYRDISPREASFKRYLIGSQAQHLHATPPYTLVP